MSPSAQNRKARLACRPCHVLADSARNSLDFAYPLADSEFTQQTACHSEHRFSTKNKHDNQRARVIWITMVPCSFLGCPLRQFTRYIRSLNRTVAVIYSACSAVSAAFEMLSSDCPLTHENPIELSGIVFCRVLCISNSDAPGTMYSLNSAMIVYPSRS